jgi:DNA topoisomerase-1
MKILIIVESPSKCKKIEKYLNESFKEHSFKCVASVGHIKKLSVQNYGVDVSNNFKPNFIIDSKKKKAIGNIKKNAKWADKIVLAADLDAEGERIAFDVASILKLNLNENNRMIFNEITKNALKESFENLTKINQDLVNAQTARRVLDRLIGFKISEITRKNVYRGASAGRVLSVTTKLVKEREDEVLKKDNINEFYITGNFEHKKYKLLDTSFNEVLDNKTNIQNILEKLKISTYNISNIEQKSHKSKPSPPFITSTINQASPYSIKKTSAILQKLYQGGHITYIRTDSTNLSVDAREMIKKYILDKYSNKYYKDRKYGKKIKGAQEAHECIRPTDLQFNSNKLEHDSKVIYDLIFKRTIACLMSDYLYKSKTIKVDISELKNNYFEKKLIKNEFLGWKIIYKGEDVIDDDKIYKTVKTNDTVNYIDIIANEKYKSKTGRFTESSLVKKLEDLGIGRPSTYSLAVSNIQDKGYVVKHNIEGNPVKTNKYILKNNNIQITEEEQIINAENNKLQITELGKFVTEYLDINFDKMMTYSFTAQTETDFDKIKQKKLKWQNVVKKYYNDLEKIYNKLKENTLDKKFSKKKTDDNNGFKKYEIIGKYRNKKVMTFQSKWGPRIVYGDFGKKTTQYFQIPKEINKTLEEFTIDDFKQLIKLNKKIK